jgi:hypothetical protein
LGSHASSSMLRTIFLPFTPPSALMSFAANIGHRSATKNEAIALVSDVGIFLVLAAILFVAMT